MNTDAINFLVSRWAEPDGIPFKRGLISDDGCMCAQGQVLHYIGGISVEELRQTEQLNVDRECARLLGISIGHSVLLRDVNDNWADEPSVVFMDSKKVLGDQAGIILAFWRHLDRMTPEQWAAAEKGALAAPDAALIEADFAGCAAAGDAAWDAARQATSFAEMAARGDGLAEAGTWALAASYATSEIQGARVIRERNRPFFFLPMFGFADPEAILAADAAIHKQPTDDVVSRL